MKKNLLVILSALVIAMMAFAANAYGADNKVLSMGDNFFTAPVNYDDQDIKDGSIQCTEFTAPSDGVYLIKTTSDDGAELITYLYFDGNYDDDYPFVTEYIPGMESSYGVAVFLRAGDKIEMKTNPHAYLDTDPDNVWTGPENIRININVSQIASDKCNIVCKAEGYAECEDCSFQVFFYTGTYNVVYGNDSPPALRTFFDVVYNDWYYSAIIPSDRYSYVPDSHSVGSVNAALTFFDPFYAKYTGSGADYENYFYATYDLVPKKAKVSALTPGTKSLKVKAASKVSATGGNKYQIAYRVKGTSSWKKVSTSSQSYTIKNLKKGKVYQVKVRAYKGSYYGDWSSIKTSGKIK